MTRTLMTRRELAACLGCHPQTIVKWEAEGLQVVERGRRGKPSTYDLAAVQAWLKAREEAARGGDSPDLVRERARKERAQALLAEQLHATRAAKLLPADAVARVWAKERERARRGILRAYVEGAARVFRAGERNGLSGVERELKALGFEVLRDLATPGHRRGGRRKAP